MKHSRKRLFYVALGALLIVLAPVFHFIIAPQYSLKLNESDFNFELQVFSVDNIYDENLELFSGEQKSNTSFRFQTKSNEDGVIEVHNVFEVRGSDGDLIVKLERDYGIEQETGQHAAEHGDKAREGYLFGPRMKGPQAIAEDKSDFIYWHINYDAPANMYFVDEDVIAGLKVYHYETNYEDSVIDQTEFLGHLEGVPEERGVVLEPHLELWIEPYTGMMVNYRDETRAYFYDIQTGEKLHPWNFFRNTVDDSSIIQLTESIQRKKIAFLMQALALPSLFLLAGFSLVLYGLKH